ACDGGFVRPAAGIYEITASLSPEVDLAPPGLLLDRLPDHVAGNSEEPGRHMRLRAEGTQSGISAHECLLRQLFRPSPITQNVVYEIENRLSVAMKYGAEGIRVTSKRGVQCGISSFAVPAAHGLRESNFGQ